MDMPPGSTAPLDPVPGTADRIPVLLQSLEDSARRSGHASGEASARAAENERRLAEARLGLAGSLFVALRCKHAPTASHCLRVALGCSAWAAVLEMPESLRTQLELAALLHDIGKLGVPDSVLMKQSRLQPEDVAALNRSPLHARDILSQAGAPDKLIEVVTSCGAWFDGSRGELAGDQIPVLARILSIVDAYDSMTTDHVYRPAKSQERAVAELFECAGSQFDPGLVRSFVDQLGKNQAERAEEVSQRWLSRLGEHDGGLPWEYTASNIGPAHPGGAPAGAPMALFEKELIDHMHDGVVFVSPHRQIVLWNTGAERMTGVASSAAVGQTLTPSLLVMSAPDGRMLADEECPIAEAITSGQPNAQRLSVIGRKGKHIEVDLHAIPVCSPSDGVLGATVLLNDASSEASLEQRCQALHVEMTKDPMTQVANRAEFDRALNMFVDAHQETGLPCSLIMADIDHFKSINDNFGHQAGDEAIISFATLLKSMCRTGDLVARYGGEEFAVLCADCNNATAASRAEQMRRALSETVQSELGGKSITASFGVSELQAGDTPETLLRRSDRALLQAKDQGRNQVVQLGAGMEEEEPKKSWWSFSGWGKSLVETTLVTNVPIEVAVEKLKGFIADHDAKILKTAEHELRIECSDASSLRRAGDRPVGFVLDLKLAEEVVERESALGLAKGTYAQTTAIVTIRPRHERDRRRGYATERARKLLGSLRSYLMAKEADAEPAAAAGE